MFVVEGEKRSGSVGQYGQLTLKGRQCDHHHHHDDNDDGNSLSDVDARSLITKTNEHTEYGGKEKKVFYTSKTTGNLEAQFVFFYEIINYICICIREAL